MKGLALVFFLWWQHVTAGPSIMDVLSTESSLSEDVCLEALAQEAFEPTQLNAKLLGVAMTKGYWKCAKEIAAIATSARIDVRGEFDMQSRTLQRELTGLKTAIESSLPMSNINPAFQWAQSTTDVFLNVKFAHKLDAPATLNVEVQNVSLTENGLSLRASDGRKLFSLDLDFLKDIVPEDSSWSLASVGRMTINIKKKVAPSKWVRLIKEKKKTANIHRWFEIQEKYSDELEAIEDEEDEEDGVSPKKKESGETNSTSPSSVNATENKKTKKKVKRADSISKTPEEEEYKKEKKRLLQEKRDKIKEIDADAKSRKNEIDAKAKEDKKAIDENVAVRKKAVEAEHEKELSRIDAARKSTAAGGGEL